jgi:16S rRNA processing protein RimM
VKTLLQTGYIARAHGLKGELAVKTFDPASSAISEVESLTLRLRDGSEQQYTVKTLRNGPQGDLLVTFPNVSTREQAETFVGAGVFLKREELDAPAQGEFFFGDLVDLAVFDVNNIHIGSVTEVWSSGPVPNLVVKRVDGAEELMIPFADDFIKHVDVGAQKITVVVPEFE